LQYGQSWTVEAKSGCYISHVPFVVGCVIGAGVFFKPYAIYQATGGAPGMGMLAWIVGGLASILGTLTFAEVAILIPKTGGMVAYLGEVFDERLGFLADWMQIIIFYPAFLAGYGVKVGTELAEYIGDDLILPVAIGVIALTVAVNIMDSRTAAGIQVISTACKLIPLAVLIVFGFLLGSGEHAIFTPMVGEGKTPEPRWVPPCWQCCLPSKAGRMWVRLPEK